MSEYTRELGITSGILLAVPAPPGQTEVFAVINAAIEQAVQESELNGMSTSGQDVTPWLLERVQELTEGLSIRCSEYLQESFDNTTSFTAIYRHRTPAQLC